MHAIETRYQGYRFRSRLEARWAVFFDALSLKWEYEPEGYDLGSAGYYLPDFYLPDLDGGSWVEVKPDGIDKHNHDEPKWRALVEQSGKPLLLATGVPDAGEYQVLHNNMDNETGVADTAVWTTACFQQKYLPPINHDGNPRLYWCPGGPEDCDVDEAIEAARSARFEHGENGISPTHSLMLRLSALDAIKLTKDPSEMKRRIMKAREWGLLSGEETADWIAMAGLKHA